MIEAYQAIAARRQRETKPATPPGVDDLGLVEVPAAPSSRDLMAVMLSGDGGWAGLDKGVAAGLAAAGVPVVGWSSLGYYWSPRTPEGAAADLARVIERYATAWKKGRVLLVGYSFGADVLPFLVNRLPEATRSRVAGVTLLGLSDTAAFELRVASWLGGGGDARYRTAPEVARLQVPVACVRGADEADSACRALTGPHVREVELAGGHHFGGDYSRLVEVVLSAASGH